MAVGVSLSACDSNKESVTIEDASAEKSEQTVAEPTKEENTTAHADLDGATAQQGTPVK